MAASALKVLASRDAIATAARRAASNAASQDGTILGGFELSKPLGVLVMEWVAAVIAFALGILALSGAVGIGYELARHKAWQSGYDNGEAAWKSNQERCDAHEARVIATEKAIACERDNLEKWALQLDGWHRILEKKDSLLSRPLCNPTYYEQLCTPCMN